MAASSLRKGERGESRIRFGQTLEDSSRSFCCLAFAIRVKTRFDINCSTVTIFQGKSRMASFKAAESASSLF
jgi:hypothetical protein